MKPACPAVVPAVWTRLFSSRLAPRAGEEPDGREDEVAEEGAHHRDVRPEAELEHDERVARPDDRGDHQGDHHRAEGELTARGGGRQHGFGGRAARSWRRTVAARRTRAAFIARRMDRSLRRPPGRRRRGPASGDEVLRTRCD